MEQQYKSVRKWSQDKANCGLGYLTLLKAIKEGSLKASRPKGRSTWRVTNEDMAEFLRGGV